MIDSDIDFKDLELLGRNFAIVNDDLDELFVFDFNNKILIFYSLSQHKKCYVAKDENEKYILLSNSDFAMKFKSVNEVLSAIKLLLIRTNISISQEKLKSDLAFYEEKLNKTKELISLAKRLNL